MYDVSRKAIGKTSLLKKPGDRELTAVSSEGLHVPLYGLMSTLRRSHPLAIATYESFPARKDSMPQVAYAEEIFWKDVLTARFGPYPVNLRVKTAFNETSISYCCNRKCRMRHRGRAIELTGKRRENKKRRRERGRD